MIIYTVQISCKVEQRIVRFLETIWNPDMPRRSVIPLTHANVKNLTPRDARYEVFDASLAGFGVRISSSGTKKMDCVIPEFA